jgi:hypothetical protein
MGGQSSGLDKTVSFSEVNGDVGLQRFDGKAMPVVG